MADLSRDLLRSGYLEYWSSDGKLQIQWDGHDWDGRSITEQPRVGRLPREKWIADQHQQYAAILTYRQTILDAIELRHKALEKEKKTAQKIFDSFASQYDIFNQCSLKH